MIEKPGQNEYAPYYDTYISKVDGDVIQALKTEIDDLIQFINTNKERLEYKYGPQKWTIKEVMVHISDTEQILSYRMLRIARGDTTPLAGFDQNTFINNSDFSHLDYTDLIALLQKQRAHTISLISSIKQEEFDQMGTASGHQVSARALLYMIAGHAKHHLLILKERYV